ncbi:MAG: hypothetical protein ACK4VN_15905 [Bacteroidales bacterium]
MIPLAGNGAASGAADQQIQHIHTISSPMNTRLQQFADSFDRSQTRNFSLHFIEFTDYFEYADVLGEEEYKLVYLAWLWAHGWVYNNGESYYFIKQSETGLSMKDFALYDEVEYDQRGKTDLLYTYLYYELDELRERMGWNEPRHYPCPVKSLSEQLYAKPGRGPKEQPPGDA